MSDPILIAYATGYGSTQEVAEATARELRERGLEVEIQPLRQVQTTEGYGLVVGTPFHMGHWLGEVNRFLTQHREALGRQPVALFALGPTHPEHEEWQEARTQLDQELAGVPWFKPVATEMFGGRFDPAKLRFPDSLIARWPASPHQPPSDVRDWKAIQAWASKLATELQPAVSR